MTVQVKGIGYDAGVLYERDFESHPRWTVESARADLRMIRDELHCTHVLVMATDTDRLLATARTAREEGLAVWLQPRLFEGTRDEVAAHLADVAVRAEELRVHWGDVALNVGCELTLSTRGFLPGKTFWRRGLLLPVTFWLLPIANHRLRTYLQRLVEVARERFHGELSYGAGSWERVDWSQFDVVGLDAYRELENRWHFADDLRREVQIQHAAGRPVYVFEFGTCAYQGASARASQAAGVLQERGGSLAVPSSLRRDEQEQARYLAEMLDTFDEVDVDGAFVYAFSEPALTRSDVPERDLDLASYGVVAVDADGARLPKAAFRTISDRYLDNRSDEAR